MVFFSARRGFAHAQSLSKIFFPRKIVFLWTQNMSSELVKINFHKKNKFLLRLFFLKRMISPRNQQKEFKNE